MSKDIRNINLIFATVGFSMSILGLVHTMVGRFVDRRTKSFFIALFSVLNVYVLSVLVRELTYDHMGTGWAAFSRVLFLVQGILAATITIIITAFMLDQCGIRPYKDNGMFRAAVILYLVYAVLLITNLFTKKLYYVDDFNAYSRNEWFPVLVIPTAFIMLINLGILYQNRDRLSAWQKRGFLIYSLIPLVAMLIQAFLFGVHLIAISSVIAALFALTYIIYDQTERYYRIESENDRLKMDIMLAQIQPHFLFNSLTTIKNLIRNDPERAEDGIAQFRDYLRHNMDSLTMDTPIPFEDELSHVEEYVFLQKLRFGDDIEVRYDIEYRDFRIPTLTLQPLVENAIIHGIRKKESGCGKVVISSKKVGDHVEVSVTDDGPGFNDDERSDNGRRSHMGIRNVRERIGRITGTDLKIESVDGMGTCVTITIPEGGRGRIADICS